MGPPAVSLVLVLALGLTLEAEGTSVPPKSVAGQFDDIRTQISDMRAYLRQGMDAIEVKIGVALALADTKCKASNGEANPGGETIPGSTERQIFCQPCKNQLPKDCQEVYNMGSTSSGVYTIGPEPNIQFDVYCEQELDGGGWVVFQLRKDGTVDFYRNWNEYKEGFGQLKGEFWLGNDKIHHLTKRHDQELKIRLTSYKDEVEFANYAVFWIEGPDQKFKLHVDQYSGGKYPGDSLKIDNGMKFSTKDDDNDALFDYSCAQTHGGAWWYHKCGPSGLNGKYGSRSIWKGMHWAHWKKNDVSMKGTLMMLRKKADPSGVINP